MKCTVATGKQRTAGEDGKVGRTEIQGQDNRILFTGKEEKTIYKTAMMPDADLTRRMFNMGKSNAKVYVKSSNGINFSDIEGVDEAEENLQEIVDYLDGPEKYREIDVRMPKGVLLVGSPGVGGAAGSEGPESYFEGSCQED